jgi:integrase
MRAAALRGYNMTLAHYSRIPLPPSNSSPTGYLIRDDEHQVEAYSAFEALLISKGYAFSTRKRYSEAVARFLDYLTECGAFNTAVTAAELDKAVENYPSFLDHPEDHQDGKLQSYARKIGFRGLAPSAFSPTLAAVNLFLTLLQDNANEMAEVSPDPTQQLFPSFTIEAINGVEILSSFEKRNLRERSVLAAVVRMHKVLKRPRGLRKPSRLNPPQADLERLDFPLEYMGKLVDAANSWRDRVLWLGQAAAGLRKSEMLNLQISDVDPETQKLWVFDPEYVRFGRQLPKDMVLRFKGRTMSETCLFEPLKTAFFEALGRYLREEYIPGCGHNFLLQRLDSRHPGQPLARVSDTALNQAFKAAVQRAGVPPPPNKPDYVWTSHSLRHAYGVFMLNHIPIQGGFGLRLNEVKTLMGHRDIASTQHYARTDREILRAKLQMADMFIMESGYTLDDFPALVASRLRQLASLIEEKKL